MSGGYAPAQDLMRVDVPTDDVNYRESVSMWIFDDAGRIQFPRFLLDDVAGSPGKRALFLNIAFPNGRAVVRHNGVADAFPALDEKDQPTIYGAGGMTFRCVEPFREWTATYRGPMQDTTSAALMLGQGVPTDVDVELDVHMSSVVPPWEQGTLSGEAKALMKGDTVEARFMGVGWRYEQLVLADGRCRIGDDTWGFTGRGLRVHRQSSRDTTGFWGHCWQSAVFPSGRAFGYISFPPNPEGTGAYDEGFVFVNREMVPARVMRAPWMKVAAPSGQDATVVLETRLGEITIHAETYATTFRSTDSSQPEWGGGWPSSLLLQQGCARYRWGNEEAFGMIERSAFKSDLDYVAPRA